MGTGQPGLGALNKCWQTMRLERHLVVRAGSALTALLASETVRAGGGLLDGGEGWEVREASFETAQELARVKLCLLLSAAGLGGVWLQSGGCALLP